MAIILYHKFSPACYYRPLCEKKLNGNQQAICDDYKKAIKYQVSNNGNNQSGFPGGYRYFTGAFISFCNSGYWWSSTEYPSHNVRSFYLDYSNDFANKNLNKKEEGLSVRCLRD